MGSLEAVAGADGAADSAAGAVMRPRPAQAPPPAAVNDPPRKSRRHTFFGTDISQLLTQSHGQFTLASFEKEVSDKALAAGIAANPHDQEAVARAIPLTSFSNDA